MKVVSLLLCIPVSLHAFLPRTLDAKYRGSFELRAEDGVNLSPLENIAEDASWLGESVRNWLDKEYIDLAIHSDIGLF